MNAAEHWKEQPEERLLVAGGLHRVRAGCSGYDREENADAPCHIMPRY